MTTVCIFAPELSHELETIGFYFRQSQAHVDFATQHEGPEGSEHPWSLRRLEQAGRVSSISAHPSSAELLIADAFLNPRYACDLARWVEHANNVAFLFPHRGMTVKRRAGHLLRSWPHSVSARMAIFFGDRRRSLDTLSPAFQRRVFFAPYLHPQSLSETALDQIFSDFLIDGHRRYRIGFMGNKNPVERSVILAKCRAATERTTKESFWIQYGDDEHHIAFPPDQFIARLGELDFCLCPTGWSRWTHRVVESLCRGSIPILEDIHLYGIDLRDRVHCILVRDGDWVAAVEAALSLSVNQIEEMRRHILTLRDELLRPPSASARFSQQFRMAAGKRGASRSAA